MQENKTVTPVKRNYAAKRRTKRAIALAGLAVFMALTIGLTWTYWRAGVTAPDDPSRPSRFAVHTGSEFRTDFRLCDVQFGLNNPLMPYDIRETGFSHEWRIDPSVDDPSVDAVGQISKVIEVEWIPYSDHYHIPAGTSGTLTLGVENWLAFSESDPGSGDFDTSNTIPNFDESWRFRNRYESDLDYRYHNYNGLLPAGPDSVPTRTHGQGVDLNHVDLFEVTFTAVEGVYVPDAGNPTDLPNHPTYPAGHWEAGLVPVAPLPPSLPAVTPIVPEGRHFPVVIQRPIFITVTVRMNIPHDSDVYEAIAGNQVAFQLALNIINPMLPTTP